jgi:hypothetical protein
MALGVTVDFNANVARFIDQIDRISDDLGRFEQRAEAVSAGVKKAFEAIGITLSVAGIGAFLKAGIDDLDALNDMADRTGIAAKELAGLQLGLKLSDTTAEAFANTANKLSINISKNREEFAKLGITARDPLEAMIQFADVFASIEDPQERAVLGTQALGKAYAELAPLLLQGGAAIREQIADGQRWSGVTNEMARQAADFNDSLDAMTFRLQALKIRAVGPLLGDLNTLIDYLGDLNTEIGETNGAVDDMTESFLATGNWIKPFSGGIAEIIYLFERLGLYVDAAQKKIDALLHLDVGRLKALTGDYENAVDAANARLNATQNKIIYGAADDVLKTNQEILTTIDKIDALRERSKTDTGLAKIIDAEEKRLDGLLKKSTELNQSINPDFKFENFTPRAPKLSGISLGGDKKGKSDGSKNDLQQFAEAEIKIEQDKFSALKELTDARFSYETAELEEIFNQRLRLYNDDKVQQINIAYELTSKKIAIEKEQIEKKQALLEEGIKKELAIKQAELSAETDRGDKKKIQAEIIKLETEIANSREISSLAVQKLAIDERKANAERAQSQIDLLNQVIQKYDNFAQRIKTFDADAAVINASNLPLDRKVELLDEVAKAYAKAGDEAKGSFKQMSAFADEAARNMQDAFANFLFDPFAGGTENMVDNFATALRRMAAEQLSAQIFDWAKGLFKDTHPSIPNVQSANNGGGFFDTIAGWGSSLMSLFASANGNIFQGGNVVPFAKGGVFDGGNVIPFAKGDIFDKPVTFPMRDGRTGLMAEAGPEAIMPLTRGPDGKLGVRASGSGSSGMSLTINQYFDSSTPRDVRRATGQAARDALGMLNGASRYG